MFSLGQMASLPPATSPSPDGKPRTIPPATKPVFPDCTPQVDEGSSHSADPSDLVSILQSIYRPPDVTLAHFQALGLHVIPDAPAEDIIPDPSFLPPADEWTALDPETIDNVNESTRRPLNNGNLSPGVKTFVERQKELSIDNAAAFRTVRRLPAPAGEKQARLGNAYEFFKNLEYFSGYWEDTSLPPKSETCDEAASTEENAPELPPHLQIHVRAGTGPQMPTDYRQQLLTAFIKLVAYDFGCNVSIPRIEPRLHLAHPSPTNSKSHTRPPSYFTSPALTFITRTPTDRTSARTGIIEGPAAVISGRASTTFAKPTDSYIDLAREVIAILLTAQQRAREGKQEIRFGAGKWWTEKKRWGGGPGGSIGREADKADELADPTSSTSSTAVESTSSQSNTSSSSLAAITKAIGGIGGSTSTTSSSGSSGTHPSKKLRKGTSSGNTLHIYDNYRKMHPPSATWDRKARYSAIGTQKGVGYDDVFLVSALNHHVSIIRCRVPNALLEILSGEGSQQAGGRSWGRLCMWRSRWFDFFLVKDRVEAMQIIWGMMAYLMRKIEDPSGGASHGEDMEMKMT
ncbi:hypothetical protein F5884DRAFT_20307 [Xylogone sp. PMI_703]|nr:hypothetical protein F5884DRAFT_20307 [Xylogone sp. PMI_703]